MARTFYNGDVSAEYGGYFYKLQGWRNDYVDCIRITPCSDAGGPDNCFWIESLTVNIKHGAQQMQALNCIGMDTDEWKKTKAAARRHILINAHIAYGFYDQNYSELVRIGKPDQYWRDNGDNYSPDKVLRGNASIRAYALRVFKG